MSERDVDGAIVLVRLSELPGGHELLELAAARNDVELVGGAVRDLLLERAPRELDVVVAHGAPQFAGELAIRLGVSGELDAEGSGPTVHERFGTAVLAWDAGRIDIATRRAESYSAPGALPDVREGTPAEDLQRRDFTVNAIAVPLGGPEQGRLRAAPHASEDLEHRRLRVLHDASFRDDPTRLLRLARYRARLEFTVEDRTARLAAAALAANALNTISGARVGAELRLMLAEPDAVAAFAALDELGVVGALHPRLRFERATVERARGLLPDDGRPDLLLMAAVMLPLALRADGDPGAEIVALLDRLEFVAAERDRVVMTATSVPRLLGELSGAERPSQLRAVIAGAPPEAVALAGAISEPCAEPARRWLTELRHVRLVIDGSDLLAAGVPEGPEIGRRLEAALRLRLDGELPDGREAELAAALAVHV